MENSVLYAEENDVVTITLNRPDVRNAFDEAMIASLTQAVQKASASTARAVILKAKGESFCAGGDLNWMRRAAEQNIEENTQDALALARMYQALNVLPKPTIAQITGDAFGGGVGLAACCDIVVAEQGARFCLSEVKLGLIPSVIAPYVIKAMGARQARRYFLTAEVIDTQQALDFGLVHQIVERGESDLAVEKLLKQIFLGAPGAQTEAKKMVLEISSGKVDDTLAKQTAEYIAIVRSSVEGKDGVMSFLNKTNPVWREK